MFKSRHLVEWVEGEPSWFFRPALADELVGREALQRLQAPAEVVGCNEVGEVLSELVVAGVVEALNGGVLDGAVHALDLPVIRHDVFGAPDVPLIFGSALW